MTQHSGTGPGATGVPGRYRLSGRLDGWLTRLGVTGRFARDCLLAVVVAVVTFVLLVMLFWVVLPTEETEVGADRARLAILLCCGQALLLCLRRVHPGRCLALVVGVQLVINATMPSELTVQGGATLIAAYTVGTLLPVRTVVVAVGLATAADTVGAVAAAASGSPAPLRAVLGHLVSSALSYGGAAFVGGYVATHRRYLELLRVQAVEAVRAQQAKVSAAIGAERSRMARELHDVAAHHLSGMVVQASAVERLIDRDPAAAKDGVVWIRAQGKETLNNLRLVVGVLRGRPEADGAPGPGEGNVPVPGLAVLDDLVRTARELGSSVELTRQGQERELPPIADVALYRTVQECLSNARQHAPGAPVRIELRFAAREVALAVVNGPATRRPEPTGRTSSGVGLIGMRERAQLIGARFAAGPTPAGGWSVTVTLPTRDEARATSTRATTKGTEPT
ncbi:sensor histidine kinase [Micromonospora sp. WMMA1923]|uniref:sensor histidine kinase n=1 Tax=Micromonospora sp. WMMA1923 TaxID=3404125 RepID=UPI003B92DFB7